MREMMRENGVKKGAGVSVVGGRELELDCLEGNENSSNIGKKRMVYSMLSEMGAHLKLSCRGKVEERETSI